MLSHWSQSMGIPMRKQAAVDTDAKLVGRWHSER